MNGELPPPAPMAGGGRTIRAHRAPRQPRHSAARSGPRPCRDVALSPQESGVVEFITDFGPNHYLAYLSRVPVKLDIAILVHPEMAEGTQFYRRQRESGRDVAQGAPCVRSRFGQYVGLILAHEGYPPTNVSHSGVFLREYQKRAGLRTENLVVRNTDLRVLADSYEDRLQAVQDEADAVSDAEVDGRYAVAFGCEFNWAEGKLMARITSVSLCVTVFAAAPLAAQGGEQSDVHLRNDCRLAAQVIRTGHPAPQGEWAYSLISQCPEAGPSALASRWRATDVDTLTLQRLLRATSRLRTRETYQAVRSAARDPQGPSVVRIYALSMLYSFAHPGRSVRVSDLLHPRDRGPRIYRASGDAGTANAPELGDVRAEIENLLDEIITAGGNAQVARAAMMVRDRL